MKAIRIFGRIKKKLFRKKPVLILATVSLCVILVGGVALAYTVYKSPTQQTSNKSIVENKNKKQTTSNQPETETPQQKPVESAPQPQPASPTPSNPQTPATPKPGLKPKAGAPTQTPCEKYIPVYYSDYNKKVAAETSQHAAILAALKQAYESNPYPGPEQTMTYDANIAAENSRFNQASIGNYNNYQSTLAALGCYI